MVGAMLKDAVDLSTLHRVLVVKLRHLGDVLLTSPVFTVLKNHVPHAEIDALVYRDPAHASGHREISGILPSTAVKKDGWTTHGEQVAPVESCARGVTT
jgi:heptosyltransferase-3